MMRAFTPIVKPHGRIVNVASMVGHLSRLASSDLRDKFSSPSLTEAELVGLMEEFISDVKAGKHRGKWCNTFYSTSKVGEVALTKVYARELTKTGKYYGHHPLQIIIKFIPKSSDSKIDMHCWPLSIYPGKLSNYCSVPQWHCVTCWNGHRQARASSREPF